MLSMQNVKRSQMRSAKQLDETSQHRAARSTRYLTLWQALVWTYRDQLAHKLLATPWQWFVWALARGVTEGPRPSVHVDAALLHAEVLSLGQERARLIAGFAASATVPEVPQEQPMPRPVTASRADGLGEGERWSWEEVAARRITVKIRWNESVIERTPILRRVGRNKMRIAGYRRRKIPVEFCPIDWSPHPEWVAAMAQLKAEWRAAIELLAEAVADLEFHEIVVVGSLETDLPAARGNGAAIQAIAGIQECPCPTRTGVGDK